MKQPEGNMGQAPQTGQNIEAEAQMESVRNFMASVDEVLEVLKEQESVAPENEPKNSHGAVIDITKLTSSREAIKECFSGVMMDSHNFEEALFDLSETIKSSGFLPYSSFKMHEQPGGKVHAAMLKENITRLIDALHKMSLSIESLKRVFAKSERVVSALFNLQSAIAERAQVFESGTIPNLERALEGK